MKQILTLTLFIVIALLLAVPGKSLAQDTLVVYATPTAIDVVIGGDTTSAGLQKHKVYKLVSRDTTYLFNGSITSKSNLEIFGVLDPTTGRPPCIQPAVLPDNSIPGNFVTMVGKGTKAVFKNLYILGLATNGASNGGNLGIQISADSITTIMDNCVMEEWVNLAIGYSANWDKFIITNSKFRNMVHPNQWYIGEVLRNEWPGNVYTDSVIMRYNTMFCVNGYASCPVTKYYTKYIDFSHNSVVYTFKNPLFFFNMTEGKINSNIFYGAWAGGIAKAEYPWWDQLWSPEVGSIIDFDTLSLATDSLFNPGDMANPNFKMLSEAKRKIEVKNNTYFWPKAMTDAWKAWNDTAHVDSIYTATWMNTRTSAFFNNPSIWPGMVQSGNLNADPTYGTGVNAVMTQTTDGLLDWFALCRRGTLSITQWGYHRTVVGAEANWKPAWPLPENTDMQYTNNTVKSNSTDGLPAGDPWWFKQAPTGVRQQPQGVPLAFALEQNFPNPFNPTTEIEFSLSSSGQVRLTVYNLLGQEVATLAAGEMKAGTHAVTFDASRLASGVYLYKLTAGNYVSTKKMVLMK